MEFMITALVWWFILLPIVLCLIGAVFYMILCLVIGIYSWWEEACLK